MSQVLTPTPGKWDGVYTCDPSVISGSFIDPDDGLTYAYALYYTATNNTPGTANSIGIAYSHDGVSWKKFSGNPVIRQQVVNPNTYGAGQASTYSSDGKSSIYLFHTDTSAPPNAGATVLRTSADGIHFTGPVSVPDLAASGETLLANGDFAYDPADGYFYRAAETSFRAGDRESYGFGLFKIPAYQLIAGQGTWQALGFMNTAMSGFYLNHSPGLVRDQFGNVGAPPNLWVWWAGGTNDAQTWDLTNATWGPVPSSMALSRYYDSTVSKHWVTTGFIGAGYHLEYVMGYPYIASQPGTQPIFGCTTSISHFLSPSSSCEGQTSQGPIGWFFSAPPPSPATIALYRCYVPATQDHFVSPDPLCEGQVVELNGNPLGYVPTTRQ